MIDGKEFAELFDREYFLSNVSHTQLRESVGWSIVDFIDVYKTRRNHELIVSYMVVEKDKENPTKILSKVDGITKIHIHDMYVTLFSGKRRIDSFLEENLISVDIRYKKRGWF